MTIKQLVMLITVNNSVVILGGFIAGEDITPIIWAAIGAQAFIMLFWAYAEWGYRKIRNDRAAHD